MRTLRVLKSRIRNSCLEVMLLVSAFILLFCPFWFFFFLFFFCLRENRRFGVRKVRLSWQSSGSFENLCRCGGGGDQVGLGTCDKCKEYVEKEVEYRRKTKGKCERDLSTTLYDFPAAHIKPRLEFSRRRPSTMMSKQFQPSIPLLLPEPNLAQIQILQS